MRDHQQTFDPNNRLTDVIANQLTKFFCGEIYHGLSKILTNMIRDLSKVRYCTTKTVEVSKRVNEQILQDLTNGRYLFPKINFHPKIRTRKQKDKHSAYTGRTLKSVTLCLMNSFSKCERLSSNYEMEYYAVISNSVNKARYTHTTAI